MIYLYIVYNVFQHIFMYNGYTTYVYHIMCICKYIYIYIYMYTLDQNKVHVKEGVV